MTDPDPNLTQDLKAAWHRYIDMLVPLRPGLYAYCRRLTVNIWDAEDLVQDTLARAFARWGVTYPEITNAKAYLIRIATNVWIDGLRRAATEDAYSVEVEVSVPDGGDEALSVRAEQTATLPANRSVRTAAPLGERVC